jgi:glutamate mutase epsilon subunit
MVESKQKTLKISSADKETVEVDFEAFKLNRTVLNMFEEQDVPNEAVELASPYLTAEVIAKVAEYC